MLAERLGFRFFDTGVMYRAVTRTALDTGFNLEDEQILAEVAASDRIVYLFPPDGGVEIAIYG